MAEGILHMNKYRRYYLRHRDEILERLKLRRNQDPMPGRIASRKWKAKNRKAVSSYNKNYAQQKPEVMREKERRWRTLNPERWRMIQRKVKKAMVSNASDSYIRDLLNKNTMIRQPWPTAIIELKRVQLQLARYVKANQHHRTEERTA